MDMIWSIAIPTAEDRKTEYGTPYKWSDYMHNVSSIILVRHDDADRIMCVNDPYYAAYSTKDDERDLRVQGKAHFPVTYMKLADPSPVLSIQNAAVYRQQQGAIAKIDIQLPDRLSTEC